MGCTDRPIDETALGEEIEQVSVPGPLGDRALARQLPGIEPQRAFALMEPNGRPCDHDGLWTLAVAREESGSPGPGIYDQVARLTRPPEPTCRQSPTEAPVSARFVHGRTLHVPASDPNVAVALTVQIAQGVTLVAGAIEVLPSDHGEPGNGDELIAIGFDVPAEDGTHEVTVKWDGSDQDGQRLPSGRYRAVAVLDHIQHICGGTDNGSLAFEHLGDVLAGDS